MTDSDMEHFAVTTIGSSRVEVRSSLNHFQAVAITGIEQPEIVGEAHRSAPGNVWRVRFPAHRRNPGAAHARVSGDLPETLQRKLITALLEVAAGLRR